MDDSPIVRKYISFDEMKADEYRYWQSRPAHERWDAVEEMIQTAYALKGWEIDPDVPRLQRPFVRLPCPWHVKPSPSTNIISYQGFRRKPCEMLSGSGVVSRNVSAVVKGRRRGKDRSRHFESDQISGREANERPIVLRVLVRKGEQAYNQPGRTHASDHG